MKMSLRTLIVILGEQDKLVVRGMVTAPIVPVRFGKFEPAVKPIAAFCPFDFAVATFVGEERLRVGPRYVL